MPCIDISSLSNAKKDVEKYGCEWKDWYYEKAISPKNSVEDIRFWYTEGKSQIEEVPVCMIVGQDHDRYNSRQEEPRWITLLQDMVDRWKNTEPADVIKDIEINNCSRILLNYTNMGIDILLAKDFIEQYTQNFWKWKQ